ncbi:MAG: transglycosylase domain-containing protein [Bacteroidaceae bacterium]|nr:transglycosylase domain-containing protein [Bacteroidaceae bacterium]
MADSKILKLLAAPFKGYAHLYIGKPWWRKLITTVLSVIVFFLFFLLAVDNNFLWLFGKSPSMQAISNPIVNEASMLYSADGKLLGKYFNENRSPVTYEEISPILIETLINTEDERFYKHKGIDFVGLTAAAKDIAKGRGRGASTITQQLVKNMFRVRTEYSTGLCGKVPGLKLFIQKMKEWISATKIEAKFNKQEILTMYLNTVDFGSNAFGIKTAAKTYFNTTPDQLNYEQSAVLVGLLKATTTYNPKLNPKNSLKRRNVVLANMLSHKAITKKQYDSLTQIPIHLNYSVENNYDGQALYFRQAVANYLRDWCKNNGYDLYADGLKIYTTIDTRLQKYAEEAALKQMKELQDKFDDHWQNMEPWRDERGQVIPNFIEDLSKKSIYYKMLDDKYDGNKDSIDLYMNKPHKTKVFTYKGVKDTLMSTMDSLRYTERFLHCSFVAMEPQTSEVKAWVGDLNFEAWKYDKVTGNRQPGSTFKLFVYTEAMNQGLTQFSRRTDSYYAVTMEGDDGKKTTWAPHNANGYSTGENMTLRRAFAQSVNTIAAKLGMEVGINNVIKTAHAMGIKSKLENVPSVSLGSSDVNLLELINGYCTVVNDGKHIEPVLVTKILDRDGKIIYKADERPKQVIPYRSAWMMQQLLLAGMREYGGTSQALWRFNIHNYDTDFGGKTGTSSNHSDAWYIGTTRNLVAGAWVGGEYRCIHFRTGELGQGSRTALPIFGYFMEKVLKDPEFAKYKGKFPKEPLEDLGDIQMDSYDYERSDSDSILILRPDSIMSYPIEEEILKADTIY